MFQSHGLDCLALDTIFRGVKHIWLVSLIALLVSCSGNESKSGLEQGPTPFSDSIKNDTILRDGHNSFVNQLDMVRMVAKDSATAEYYYRRIKENLQKGRICNRNYYPESIVLGHLEEDTIIGDFDGKALDTLFVASQSCGCVDFMNCKHAENDETVRYYIVSKSGRISSIRLMAASSQPPRIVNEGDLDGDGKCEVGYMPTWMTSQWRTYRVLTYDGREWRYLIDPNDESLSTSRIFRFSGHDIVEKGEKEGTVRIRYLPEGLNQSVHTKTVKAAKMKIEY